MKLKENVDIYKLWDAGFKMDDFPDNGGRRKFILTRGDVSINYISIENEKEIRWWRGNHTNEEMVKELSDISEFIV